jgi:hypothetical protein
MAKKQRLDSVGKLIDLFGGPAAFGEEIGIDGRHASVMKGRGTIACNRWSSVLAAAKRRGIDLTADDLVRMHSEGCK